MKSLLIFLTLNLCLTNGYSQKNIYSESGGELIFSFANVVRNEIDLPVSLRFSMFFHLNEKIHYDFNENLGLYTGFALRNIGYITDFENIKMKRRTYSIGIPLALKLGSFYDHFYIYTGGSYELFFHYKQKQFINGNKRKYSEWFSPRTERLAPAIFAGVQFPGGVNLQLKYYPNDFLNKDFRGIDFGEIVDYSEYTKTQMFYISISFNIRNRLLENVVTPPQKETFFRSGFNKLALFTTD